MKEREINLIDLIYDILLRWRGIVIAMLVGMVLFGSFSYVNSYRTSKEQTAKVEAAKLQLEQELKAAQDQEIAEDAEAQALKEKELALKLAQASKITRESLEESLTDIQRYNVNYVLIYEQLYRDKAAYAEQSVTMKMDPNAVQRAEVTFLVTSDDLERTYNIVAFYEDLVRSGEVFEYIAGKVGIIASDVNEMVALEKEPYILYEGSDTLRVKVSHYDEAVCKIVTQLLTEYLVEKSNDVADWMGKHEISVVSKSQVVVNDTNVLSNQKSYLADIVSMENAIANYKSKFTEIEWEYYDILLNGEITELSISKIEAAKQSDSVGAKEKTTNESLVEIINKGVTVYPGVSIKYIVLGAFLAAIIYVFVVFVLYILNAKIRVTDNLQNLYAIPQLGLILQGGQSQKFMGFVDDWLISLRDYNKRKFKKEEAINLATVAVKMAAGKESIDNIYLIGCDVKDQALAVCKQMKAALRNEGLHVKILSNVLYDAEAMNDLEDAEGVVLVEKAGSTLYTEIAQELELLNRQGIKILGGIIVE